jgi:hypothetical protein
MRRRNLYVVLVLALLVGGTWMLRGVLFPEHHPPAPARTAVRHAAPAATRLEAPAPPRADSLAVAAAARMSPRDRNPFLTAAEQFRGHKLSGPSSETDGEGSVHRLRGIVVREGRRAAFLDGRIVGEGEHLNGLTVLRIRPDEVLVTDGARRWALVLPSIEPEEPETFRREWQ